MSIEHPPDREIKQLLEQIHHSELPCNPLWQGLVYLRR